jgi:hypothetical protein
MIAGFQLLDGHWAILQTAAWVEMVIDYSKTEGVEAGIAKTFDGKHPCSLCLSIAKNKEKQGKQTANDSLGKIYLFYQAPQLAVMPPAAFWELEGSLCSLNGTTLRPSVPPPRQYPA